MTAGRCSRMLRAALFAAVCVLLAALGHVLMSGVPVPAWTLAAGAAVTGAAGWCLAGRERGLTAVVTVVVGAQTGLHAAFELAQSASSSAPAMTGMPGMTGMSAVGSMSSMDGGHMDGHMAGMDHMAGMGDMSTAGLFSSSLGMLAAHLLAALLSGLWLAYGERAAFRILRAVAGRLAAPLRMLLALPQPPDRPRVRIRRRRSQRAPRLLLVHAITSRGPPVGCAAF
ncbi:hypothetical protein ACWD25_03350 [Streptomyces sp. NPDC002920]